MLEVPKYIFVYLVEADLTYLRHVKLFPPPLERGRSSFFPWVD